MHKRNGIYYVRINGRRMSTGEKSKRKAEKWAQAERERQADPERAARRGYYLFECLDDWIETRRLIERAPDTIAFYEKRARAVLRFFGATMLVSELDHKEGQRFIKERSEQVSPKTVLMELNVLRPSLKLALRRGLTLVHPDAIFPAGFSAKYKPSTRWLTWCEAGQLLIAAKGSSARGTEGHRRAQIAFSLATGGRVEEVDRAQPEDIDFANNRVWMRGTKTTRSAAFVPILPGLRWMLELAQSQMPFRPWSSTNGSRDLRKWCKAAGIEPVTRRGLRKTTAQWLAQIGCDPGLVSTFLRNSKVVAAEVYARLAAPELREAILRRVER